MARYVTAPLALLLVATAGLAVERGAVVIKRDADLKVSGKKVGEVKAGDIYTVHAVRGAWIEVGEETKGWVRADNVVQGQEAIAHITKQLLESPSDSKLLLTRAKMHLAQLVGNRTADEPELEAAEHDLQEALQAAPHDAEVRYAMAQLALRCDDREQAETRLAEAIELNAKEPRFYELRGKLLQLRGDQAAALKDFEEAIEQGTASAVLYNNVAWHYATDFDPSLRDGKKALKYAQQACDLTAHKNYMFLDTLAAAYAETGDFANAMRVQQEAIDACPRSGGGKAALEERLRLYRLNQPYRE
jgi:Flp pilus assembly protein TadD